MVSGSSLMFNHAGCKNLYKAFDPWYHIVKNLLKEPNVKDNSATKPTVVGNKDHIKTNLEWISKQGLVNSTIYRMY